MKKKKPDKQISQNIKIKERKIELNKMMLNIYIVQEKKEGYKLLWIFNCECGKRKSPQRR